MRFELLRADPSLVQVGELAALGRTLCMRMALDEDSSAFYRFYISDVLPRYSRSIPMSFLLELSTEFELFEETKEFFDEIQAKIIPHKRKAQKTSVKQSPVRRSPRLNNTHAGFKEKKLNFSRTFNGAVVKKQINVKGGNNVLAFTPEPALNQLSAQAKKLQEINQKYFYDKKEGKYEKNEEIKEAEGKVLVMSTPTKLENQIIYEVKQYKNIFNV